MGFHWAPNIYRADLVGSIGSTAQEMDRIKQTYSQELKMRKKDVGPTRWFIRSGIWHKMYRMARLWFQRFCIFIPNSLGK